MKHIFRLFGMLLGFHAYSQNLVLTQAAYEPAIGDSSFYNVMDSSAMLSGLPNGVTGSLCNWDFSTLVATPIKANSSYADPLSVPEASAFPACNLVQKQGSLRNYYRSVSSPSPQTEMLGLNSSSINLTFTNTAVIAKFPIGLGSSFSDNIAGTFVFSVSGNFTGTVSTVADGSGSLWLPGGQALHNVLRVKSVQTLNLLLGFLPFGTAKQVVYNYFHASQKFPVLNVTYSSLQLFGSTTPSTSVVITGNSKSIYMSLEESEWKEEAVSLYPNPVSDLLHLELDKSLQVKRISCIDARGAMLFERDGAEAIEQVKTMDLSQWPEGLYLLRFSGEGKDLSRRILVKH